MVNCQLCRKRVFLTLLIVMTGSLMVGGVSLSADRQAGQTQASSLKAVDLRCEYLKEPLGIDVLQPRLSWRLASSTPNRRGQAQSAYRVLAADSLTDLHSAYVLGPQGRGTFRNRFNYNSGRWIQIQGLDYQPALADIRGWLVRTDYARAAQFICDVPLLNRIYETTLWTLENLSLGGYFVDCPQRERMGYGGDAHATLFTALNNYDLGAFYSKWAEDWRDVQGKSAAWGVGRQPGEAGAGDKTEAGNLPYTAPTYWGGGPAWSGFCVTLPWQVYQRYGDLRSLEII